MHLLRFEDKKLNGNWWRSTWRMDLGWIQQDAFWDSSVDGFYECSWVAHIVILTELLDFRIHWEFTSILLGFLFFVFWILLIFSRRHF